MTVNYARILTFILALISFSTFAQKHLYVEANKNLIHKVLKLSIKSFNVKDNVQVLPITKGENLYQHLTLVKDQHNDLAEMIQELFDIDLKKGMPLHIAIGNTKLRTTIKDSYSKVIVKQTSTNLFSIAIDLKVRNLKLALDKLSFCTDKPCRKDSIYLKLKKLNIRLNTNEVPFKIKMRGTIDLSNNKVKFKINSLKNNLQDSVSPSLTVDFDEEHLQIPHIAIGPNRFNIGFSSEDLVEEIVANKEELGLAILEQTSNYLAEDFIKQVNQGLQSLSINTMFSGYYSPSFKSIDLKKIATDSYKQDSPDPYLVKRDNTTVVNHNYTQDYGVINSFNKAPSIIKDEEESMFQKIFSSIFNIEYSLALDHVKLLGEPYNAFNMAVKTTIKINQMSFAPKAVFGHGSCSKPYKYLSCEQPLKFKNSLKDSNDLGVSISESFINEALKVSQEVNIIRTLTQDMLESGIYISKRGIRVHFYRGKAYLVINLFIDLKRQKDWTARNLGPIIEKIWGSTNGKVFFPLEIPLTLKIKKDQKKTLLVIDGKVPFDAKGALYNKLGYYSNLNNTAQTWVQATSIKKTILGEVKSALFKIVDHGRKDSYGRHYIKKQEFDITPLINNENFLITPNEINIQKDGYINLQLSLDKLNIKNIGKL